MLKLQTPVEINRGKVSLSLHDKTLILGSCFADNMGRQMENLGFDMLVNPFGTLYNPQSIAGSIVRMMDRKTFSAKDCIGMGSGTDMICSFSHHTSFARKTEKEFLDNANMELARAADFLEDCTRVIITFGTSWCYRHIGSGEIVSNCLKRDAKEFSRERMEHSDIISLFSGLLEKLSVNFGKAKEFIFTVSPIRHLKDGAHGNQLSKSTLLLAVDRICSLFSNCDYFPAYEIVLDELRDYRFYAEDMTHPSQQTINYIWERFCDFAMLPGEREEISRREKAFRQSRHIPNLHMAGTDK